MNRLIERFAFRRDRPDELVIGSNVELAVGDFATLTRDAQGRFPTVTGGFDELQIATRLFQPSTCQGWLMIEADVTHGRSPEAPMIVVTSVRFRINDGTTDLWWDGAAWSAATLASEWNTEADINANLAALSFASRQIRIVTNLQTTDRRVAPRLHGVKLLWRSDVEWEIDTIYRTVLRTMREGLRPSSKARFAVGVAGTSFPMTWRADEDVALATGALAIEGGFDVVGVLSVYDLTNDPQRLVNLASAFASGPGTSATVGLSSAVVVGVTLEVEFVYAPSVALERDRDDDDKARTPGLVISSVTHEDETEKVQGEDSIAERATGVVVRLPHPRQGNIRFGFTIQAERKADRARLSDEVRRFFQATPLFRSAGLDRRYTVQLVDDFTSARVPSIEGVVERDGAFVVYHVPRYLRPAVNEVGVSQFNMRFGGETIPVT